MQYMLDNMSLAYAISETGLGMESFIDSSNCNMFSLIVQLFDSLMQLRRNIEASLERSRGGKSRRHLTQVRSKRAADG